MSPRYLGDLRVRLGRFALSFGEEMIAAISASRIDQWLRGLGVGAVTRNTFRRRLAVLFSFAKRRGYVTENPVADVERAKERETEIEIPSVNWRGCSNVPVLICCRFGQSGLLRVCDGPRLSA